MYTTLATKITAHISELENLYFHVLFSLQLAGFFRLAIFLEKSFRANMNSLSRAPQYF
jgi:hypothetical protein